MGCTLNNTGSECFGVPFAIVDNYLRLASGDQVKVLLAVLRYPESGAADISRLTKLNESDVADCLKFWELTGVISQGGPSAQIPAAGKEEPVRFIPGQQQTKEEKKTLPPADAFADYTRPSAAEIATRMDESAEIRELFRELQSKLGKTIGYDGQCTFLRLFDNYGLPPQVIYMLVDWCVNNGKSGYSYIEKAGRSWAEQEIDTIEKACEKISKLNSVNSFWNRFAIEQGLKNSKPTASQAKYIETWLNVYKMDFEMICLAYEKMVERTGKLSFAYMETMLASWHNSGYRRVSDVERAEKARKEAAAKPSDSSASYNLDKFRENGMKKTPRYERSEKK